MEEEYEKSENSPLKAILRIIRLGRVFDKGNLSG